MDRHVPTTPFGRRSASLGQIAVQMQIRQAVDAAAKPGSNHPAAINKWKLFRTVTEAKDHLGISDRALSVLNALLSFHPETALTLPKLVAGEGQGTASRDPLSDDSADPACDLVVFPSNKALMLRAHGMSEATLRRHLASLVAAGLLVRRDSPNGKRYARRAGEGVVERFSDAFGFDLTPLVVRASEFEAIAEAERQAVRKRHLLKERVSLLRRDAGKLIALGLDEALPGDWESFRQRFMRLMTPLRRIHDNQSLETLAQALTDLRAEVAIALESNINSRDLSGNAAQNARHQSNSNPKWPKDLEPASKKDGVNSELPTDASDTIAKAKTAEPGYSLGLVMEACPDVNQWATSGRVRSWSEFHQTVGMIRPMLGISPDAWAGAREALGEGAAHILVATILQRSEHSSEAARVPGETPGSSVTLVNGSPAIRSAGGYLRALTVEAKAGTFALGPVLMALIGQRMKAKRAVS